MKFTYKHYLFYTDIERYKNDIEIISMDKMDLGAIVTFYCNKSLVSIVVSPSFTVIIITH